MIISAFCFAVMNLFSRLAGPLPAYQKAFCRNFVVFIFSAVVYARYVKKEGRESFSPRTKKNLFFRGFFGLLGLIANFYAVDHLSLPDATILAKLAPFFAIIFSFYILGERLRKVQGFCLALAFLGAVFVVRPSFNNPDIISYLVAFAGGMLAGLAYTYVRLLTTHGVSRHMVVMFFGGFSSVVLLPALIFNYQPMSPQQTLYMLLVGLFGLGGQYAMTYAYSFAPARNISIFDYTQVIFSALLSALVLSEYPTWLSVVGYAIIFVASFILFQFNRRAA